MGVDYYNCDVCNEISNDCGYHIWCDTCGAFICESCVDEHGVEQDDETCETSNCPICAKKIVTTDQIFDFLLKKVNMTREQVKEEILNAKQEGKE